MSEFVFIILDRELDITTFRLPCESSFESIALAARGIAV